MSNLKALMLNGSPKPNGNAAVALHEMEQFGLPETEERVATHFIR